MQAQPELLRSYLHASQVEDFPDPTRRSLRRSTPVQGSRQGSCVLREPVAAVAMWRWRWMLSDDSKPGCQPGTLATAKWPGSISPGPGGDARRFRHHHFRWEVVVRHVFC